MAMVCRFYITNGWILQKSFDCLNLFGLVGDMFALWHTLPMIFFLNVISNWILGYIHEIHCTNFLIVSLVYLLVLLIEIIDETNRVHIRIDLRLCAQFVRVQSNFKRIQVVIVVVGFLATNCWSLGHSFLRLTTAIVVFHVLAQAWWIRVSFCTSR